MVKVVERVDGFPRWRLPCCGSPTFPRARRDRRSRVRRPWNHKGINPPHYGESQRAGLASSNSSNHSPEMWVYRILILIVYYTHEQHTAHGRSDARGGAQGRSAGRTRATPGRSVERTEAKLWAQDNCTLC